MANRMGTANKMRNLAGLLGWIFASFLAGIIGSLFEPGTWYDLLEKPSWTPPDIVFPIIWPLLYLLMGISAWLVWRKMGYARASQALNLFILQLVLNAGWSWLFFGMHMVGPAFAEIILLWIIILLVTHRFLNHDKLAGWLMVPYLLWVGFASVLNGAIFLMN